MRNIFRSRKGQGTTEYIVIVAIIVGIALVVMWKGLKGSLDLKVKDIGAQIQKAGKD